MTTPSWKLPLFAQYFEGRLRHKSMRPQAQLGGRVKSEALVIPSKKERNFDLGRSLDYIVPEDLSTGTT
jgi:hypothetical protein